MRSRTILSVAFPVIFAVVAAIIIPGKALVQDSPKADRHRSFDENRFPIADYDSPEPSDPIEQSKRRARGKKYDKSDWNISSSSQSNVARTHALDPRLPAFPVAESTAVIVGQITDAKAYLSNDKTGVYSVFTVQVNEVLKNSPTSFSLLAGSSLEVERDGGRVRFPNGRTLIYIATHMPQVGLRYVLFLANSGPNDLRILTGYELRDGKVHPLDDLPSLDVFQNADETAFLSRLRAKTAP